MKISRRRLALAAGCGFVLGLVLVAAAFFLPRLVDADRYRSLIEARLEETLGRDVRLGAIGLSLLPPTIGLAIDDVAIGALPEEGGGDLITARSLRVGARLFPLFQKRLEVTSLVLEEPRMTLARDAEGNWNVERLIVRPEGPADAGAGAETADAEGGRTGTGKLSVADLRLTGGRLTVRDATAAGEPFEVVLTDLEAGVDDFEPGKVSSFELATGFESSPGTRLELSGSGPLIGAEDGRLTAQLKVEKMSGALLATLAGASGIRVRGVLGERPIDASARLEAEVAEGGAVTVAGLAVSGADLDLRRDRAGRWNFDLEPASKKEAGDEPEGPARTVTVDGVSVTGTRVRLRDAMLADEPFAVVLDDLALELDRLPADAPAKLRLTAGLEGAGGRGQLEADGRVGPLGDAASTPMELSLRLTEIPVELLGPFLAGAGPTSGRLDADVRVAGDLPANVTVAGTAGLSGSKVLAGGKTVDLDLRARFDVAARRGFELLELRTLELDLEGNTLALSGEVEEVPAGRRWDVALAPTRLPAADLAALAELLVEDFSVAFESTEPVLIEGRATGVASAGELPDVEGRMTLRGFTLRLPQMAGPIEGLDAEVAFAGETVRVEDLSASIGGSEVAGRVTVTGRDAPRVDFTLRSPQADLGAILAAFESPEGDGGRVAAGQSVTEPDLLDTMVAKGDLAVARGSWDTLDFTDLEARIALEGGVATLEPVSMKLYDGAFSGRVVADLNVSPTAFTLSGDARDVDVAPFLADNLAVEKALLGRFTGEISATGAGDDYDSIVASLSGGGTARVVEGRLAGLDLLGTVSKVAGVLGQRTLARLADRIATESTRFERLEGRFQLAGGKMSLTELVLESPDFALAGQGQVDLLSSILGGEFQLAFSEEVSDSMRREGSRAGEVFWSPEKGRVVMPVGLRGSFSDLAASVDWGSAVKGYAKRRAVDELTGLLVEALGGERQDSGDAPPQEPASESSAEERGPEQQEALKVEITRARWGGSILLQDLKLTGEIRGWRVDRAALKAVDAGGREIERVERLGAVDAHLAGAADPDGWAVIPWEARIDGKDLVLASFPITVTVTAFGKGGEVAEARTTVEK